MSNLFSRSYLFLYLAAVAKIVEVTFITSGFFYNHLVKITLVIAMVSPIIGLILGIADSKRTAISLNICFFVIFSPLALLNFWILTFGK